MTLILVSFYYIMVRVFLSYLLRNKKGRKWSLFLGIVLLALFFQLVHFGEHIAQVAAWLSGYREMPYMTALGHYLMVSLGNLFYPDAGMMRQMQMGNEILHLIGNAIYSFGTVGILFFLRTRITIAAAVIEGLHLYEHTCLTLSAATIGTAIGASTLWGLPMEHASLVTLRVWWHFFANAIPTLLTLYAFYLVLRPKW